MIRPILSILASALCLSLVTAAAQSANAVLSGTIVDTSEAALADVRLTLMNTQTGVGLTTTSNETGVYQFRSVQPGRYRLTAELKSFQTLVYEDLVLEVSAQLNFPISLKLAQLTETVHVTAADLRHAASTASVGTLLQQSQVRDLPVPDRDVLGLLDTQPGIVKSNSANGTNYNFSGARRNSSSVTVDGFPVKDQIGNNGVSSVIYLSPDLIEEVRIVPSPADAELGRGSGQVQLSTRSGKNAFHGSVFESHRNTALNANTFFNNQRGDPRDFLIRNQFGGRLGGPIVRDKTFFHFLYDGQREVAKTPTTQLVYTETARQGIFRFYPGVVNGNFNAAVPTVDINGNPVKPATATGDLQTISVFGRDPARPVQDPTGVVQSMMDLIPLPNDFRVGDGLTTAGHTWSRRLTQDRDQFNTRIDHHLTDRHQLNFTWTHQRTTEVNGSSPQSFPDTPGGSVVARADVFAFRVTSTLPGMINEFQAGSQNARLREYAAWEGDGQYLLPTADGVRYKTTFTGSLSNIYLPMPLPSGSLSLLNQIGDSVTFVSGKHTFKFGGEYRWGGGPEAFVDIGVTPTAMFGAGNPGVTGLAPANVPGIGGNQGTAQNLLINLAGSLAQVNQRFYATGGPNYEAIPEGQHADGDILQREFSLFFKDDWKIRRDFTLNLGVRYEYYGVPWLEDTKTGRGVTAAVIGGTSGIYGLSGTSFADLYRPGHLAGTMTAVEYVGPKSPNSNRDLYNKDWNNFAPAVGLSWSMPYFGADKTVLRLGYGIGYERIPLFVVGNTVGLMPGTVAPTTFTSPQYFDLSRIHLPLTPAGVPLDPAPLTDRTTAMGIYDTNIRTGYVQNWNLSVQRTLPWNLSLDLRYVGSKGTKLVRQIDVNEANIFESGILDAFVLTQAGGNAPLLDQIFNGLNLGLGTVNGTTVTGSQSVRINPNTRPFFANNNVGGFAAFLNSTNMLSGTNVRGDLLRRAGLPENQIVGNPQFGQARIAGNFANSTYHAMQVELNRQFRNGGSVQASYTWGRTIGEHAGNSNALIDVFYRDGRNRHLDKRLLPFHRTHAFKANGTFELPFGPGKAVLGSSDGFLAHLVERWQFGSIFNMISGQPLSIHNQTSSFNQYTNNNFSNLVGDLPKDFGNVTRDSVGVLYFPGVKVVRDPAANALTTQQNLNQASLMQALADANDNLIAVNPAPGTLGTISPGYLEGPGQVRFDVNLTKRIRIGEGKDLEFRADAINVLNRTNFANPDTDINSPTFGRITDISGESRLIILGARFNF